MAISRVGAVTWAGEVVTRAGKVVSWIVDVVIWVKEGGSRPRGF